MNALQAVWTEPVEYRFYCPGNDCYMMSHETCLKRQEAISDYINGRVSNSGHVFYGLNNSIACLTCQAGVEVAKNYLDPKDRIAKVCPACGNTKPVVLFNKDMNNKDGRFYMCKKCRAEQRQRVKETALQGDQATT